MTVPIRGVPLNILKLANLLDEIKLEGNQTVFRNQLVSSSMGLACKADRKKPWPSSHWEVRSQALMAAA